MGSAPSEDWLSRSEAAARLRIGVHALSSWVAAGSLPEPTRRCRGGGHFWRADEVARARAIHDARVAERVYFHEFATRLGITAEALKTRRKRGLVPPPDGRDGSGSW